MRIKLTVIQAQESVANPDPLPKLQVRLRFKLQVAINIAEEIMG